MANRTVADLLDDAHGEDVFVVGSGVSLRGFDFERLNYVKAIALNGAISAPGFEPTFHFVLDGLCLVKWIVRAPDTTLVCPHDCECVNRGEYLDVVTYHAITPEVTKRQVMRRRTLDPRWPVKPYGFMRFPDHEPMGETTDELYGYHTVATGAIHFAAKLGARRIFLLGLDAYGHIRDGSYFDGRRSAVDMQRPHALGDGRFRSSAHFGWDMEQTKAREYWQKRGRYLEKWPGEGIFNLSEHSTLTAWEKVPTEEAFADSAAALVGG